MSMFDVKLWQQFDNTFNLSHRAIQLMFRIISKRYQGHERIVLGFFSPARRCRVAIATNKRALRWMCAAITISSTPDRRHESNWYRRKTKQTTNGKDARIIIVYTGYRYNTHTHACTLLCTAHMLTTRARLLPRVKYYYLSDGMSCYSYGFPYAWSICLGFIFGRFYQ